MDFHEELRVFKETFDLSVQFLNYSKTFNRAFKYNLTDKVTSHLIELMTLFYYANNYRDDRLQYLKLAAGLIVKIKIEIRLLTQLGELSQKRSIVLIKMIDSLHRRLGAWRRDTEIKDNAAVENSTPPPSVETKAESKA